MGPEPVIYQSIRQSDTKYGLAGRYGVIRSADEDDLDHVVVFEWRVYNGKAAQDGNIFLMYAQFENPDEEGRLESVTCQVKYNRGFSFTNDLENDVSVNSYYGSGLFEKGSSAVKDLVVGDLNKSDRLDDLIWGPDLSNPQTSFFS